MKIRLVGAELFQVGGQLIVAFLNFAEASKKKKKRLGLQYGSVNLSIAVTLLSVCL
jgi:hypothetical protein